MPVAKKRKLEEKREFLDMVADGQKVTDIFPLTGKGQDWWYKWRREDPAFDEEWDRASKKGSKKRLELLECEADRRAREGYDVVTKEQVKSPDGKTIGKASIKTVKHYSDTLLIFRIKAEAQRAGDDSYEDRQKTQVEQDVRYVVSETMSKKDAEATNDDWAEKFKPPMNGAKSANGHS